MSEADHGVGTGVPWQMTSEHWICKECEYIYDNSSKPSKKGEVTLLWGLGYTRDSDEGGLV